MSRVIVSYKVKEDRPAENEALIQSVFDQLARTAPEGLRYVSFKLEDGVSFVHLASIETKDGQNPLPQLEAFKTFVAEIGERCEKPSVATAAEIIGAYRVFED